MFVQKSWTPKKVLLRHLLLAFLLLLTAVPAFAQEDDYDADRQRAIQIAATDESLADWLAEYPDWTADGWRDDDGLWYLDFYSAAADEWLGYASVHLETEMVLEVFAPRPLSPAEYAEMQPRVMELIEADREIQALMAYPDLWEIYIEWNRWDQRWEASLVWGLEAWLVTFWFDEARDELYVDDIRDANALEAEQAERDARDQSIALAYEAEGIDRALSGHDDWTTYVSPQGENRYVVNFVVEDARLFSALVDIEAWEIVDVE